MKVQTDTVQPKWLAGVWPGAEVVDVFLDMFDSLRDESHRNLADCIKAATGAAVVPARSLVARSCSNSAQASQTRGECLHLHVFSQAMDAIGLRRAQYLLSFHRLRPQWLAAAAARLLAQAAYAKCTSCWDTLPMVLG